MEKKQLQLACFNAFVDGLASAEHGWNFATADMLRTGMLAQSPPTISPEITAMDIYHAMLPAFDFGTTDSDNSPCSFQTPEIEDLKREGIDPTLWEEGEKDMARTYVKMEVLFDENGRMVPIALHWVNGKKFTIDKVTDIRQAANLKNGASGGAGTRFTCMIQGLERCLWFMENRWFVESNAQ